MKIDSDDVITKVTTKIVEDAALGVWNKVKGYFKDLNAHDEINMGLAYEEYLKNTLNKNSKIKTLIYRHVPKDLYSFYECVGIKYSGTIISTKSINNIIDITNKVIITGTGGIGKTTLLKHLFLNSEKDTPYIPVLIELRAANMMSVEEISVFEIIFNYLVNNGFRMEKKYFDYSMEEGAYVILFDGYDEVNKDKIQKISSEIIALSGKYPKNKFIVSSRPTDGFVGWNDFVEMKSMELTKEQALHLVSKIDFDENVKKIFYKELDERLYDKYQSFASNPLLLTIMLLTFDSRASIPDKLNDFYEQAFATLFNMHDATKEAYVRDIRSGLSCEDFKLVFAYFCFKSYFSGVYEFTEPTLQRYLIQARDKFTEINFKTEDFQEDLVQSVCMLVKEGINYRFSHRSFQEYFAAWYTCKLTDDIQKRLLTNWLKESEEVYSDSYFTMLYNLQSEKVNKIILCPGLKQLKEQYKKYGFSIEFLNNLFSRLNINIESEFKDISLAIKNSYFCNILRETCTLNGYSYPKAEIEDEQQTITDIINGTKYAEKANRDNHKVVVPVKINAAVNIIGENRLLTILSWLDSQIQFAFSVLDKYEGSSIGNKRKVASILDEL